MQNETRSCPLAKEHAEIWLSPPCDSESNDGRLWAPDNPFDPCPECGAEAVRFVRADLAVSDKPCDPADPCPTAYDLACERDTLDGLWAETKDRLDAALAQVARLREALQAAVDCGMVPVSSAKDGGAVRYSRHVQVADQIRAALAETADTPAPPPADDGWTAWEGGECPVAPETLVEIRFWDGEINGPYKADEWDWDRLFRVADIVAYRIVGARK